MKARLDWLGNMRLKLVSKCQLKSRKIDWQFAIGLKRYRLGGLCLVSLSESRRANDKISSRRPLSHGLSCIALLRVQSHFFRDAACSRHFWPKVTIGMTNATSCS